MKVAVFLCIAVAATPAFAGRAFPVETETFATDLFRKLNPFIEWDPTNFLTDNAGPYAICKYAGNNGLFSVSGMSSAGRSIGGIRETYRGQGTHAEAINNYLRKVLPMWLNNYGYATQIKEAERFGCSVQPDCKGNYVVACLFSPASYGPPTGTPRHPGDEPIPISTGALAFTDSQRSEAERIFRMKWDWSYFLEDLSGLDAQCTMLFSRSPRFPNVVKHSRELGKIIEPIASEAVNSGDTDSAVSQALKYISSKAVLSKLRFGQVGCSVIPHCRSSGVTYAFVTCLFSQ